MTKQERTNRVLLILTTFFSLSAMIFSGIYMYRVVKPPAEDTKAFVKQDIINEFLSARAKKSRIFFTDTKNSEPIRSGDARRFIDHYHRTYGHVTSAHFPASIYISNDFIEAIRNDQTIDGLRLIFAAYPTTPSPKATGIQAAQDDVTIILAPTVFGRVQRDMLYDYGDPCRPTCTLDAIIR